MVPPRKRAPQKSLAAKRSRARPAVPVRMPRWKASDLRLPPLGQNQYRSKLYGLMSLKEMAPSAGFKVLDFFVCNSPESFSIRAFPNSPEGRLIVRTDINRQSHTHSMEEWVSMPRLNVYLRGKDPKKVETVVRGWMANTMKAKPGTCFIVHRVRGLRDYERSVQLNVDIPAGRIIVSTTMAGTDKFRDEDVRAAELSIDERGRIRRVIGQPAVLPEQLQQETISTLQSLIRYAERTRHSIFEASYVTYKEAPYEAEFYDLIFGKKI